MDKQEAPPITSVSMRIQGGDASTVTSSGQAPPPLTSHGELLTASGDHLNKSQKEQRNPWPRSPRTPM